MTSSLAITMLVDNKKSGGKEFFFHILECSVLNACVLHNFVHSKSSIDYLEFRLDLAESLIGTFRGRQRVGRQRSAEQLEQERLDIALGHWPEHVGTKHDYVVCTKNRQVHHLTKSQSRHESSIRCSYCKVHLCVHSERKCFKNSTLWFSFGDRSFPKNKLSLCCQCRYFFFAYFFFKIIVSFFFYIITSSYLHCSVSSFKCSSK